MSKTVLFLSKKLFLYIIIFYMFYSMVFILSQPTSKPTEVRLSLRRLQKSYFKDYKYILAWTRFFGREDAFKKLFRRHFLHECEERRCKITANKNYHSMAHAIIFDGNALYRNQHLKHSLPERKSRGQIYIFFSVDPPTSHPNKERLNHYTNFFNWTMTYRKDSDVFVPFGRTIRRKKKRPKREIHYVKEFQLQQMDTAIFLEDHCQIRSNAQDYIKNLRRYIPIKKRVDGKCASSACGYNRLKNLGNVEKDPCKILFKKYKFNIAIESQVCKDFVTEKFFRSLKLGIIPVVFGGVNYTEIAPPNSFIDSRDFNSVRELANFLKNVSANANNYNQYLKWKEDYDVDVGFPFKAHICDLCKKLHSETNSTKMKSYPSIKDWYYDQNMCINNTEIL